MQVGSTAPNQGMDHPDGTKTNHRYESDLEQHHSNMSGWQQTRVGCFIPVLVDCSYQENCQNNKLPAQQGSQELNVF